MSINKLARTLFTALMGLLLFATQAQAQQESFGFVLNEGSNAITIIDPSDNHVIGVDSLDGVLNMPHSAAYDAASHRLYVSNKGSNITVLDMSDVLAPEVIANFTPGGTGEIHTILLADGLVWFAHLGDGTVYAYSPLNFNQPRFTFGTDMGFKSVHGLAIRPGTHELWVTNRPKDAPGFVLRIDTEAHSVIGSPLPTTGMIGDQPNNTDFSANGQFGYVVNSGDQATEVTVIDADSFTVVTQIVQDAAQGLSPHGLAFDPATNLMFVSNKNGGTVSVIDVCTNMVVTYIAVGSVPQLVTRSPNGQMYVPVKEGNKLVVIDPGTLEVTTELADDASFSTPHYITFSSVSSEMAMPDSMQAEPCSSVGA